MIYKLGQVFFSVSVDDDTGKVSFEEYVIRTIRGGYAYAIWKNSLTWGKVSKKHGDYGWLTTIPAWCRKKWSLDADKDFRKHQDIHSTKLAAIRSAIKHLHLEDFENPELFSATLKTLKSMETRHKPKRPAEGGSS